MNYAYLYKITFLDNPLNYYKGSRLCPKGVKPQDDDYYGSPITHKEEWYRPKNKEVILISLSECKKSLLKHIVSLESQYITRDDIVNPMCYNECIPYYIPLEARIRGGENLHKIIRPDGLTHNEWLNSWVHDDKDHKGRSKVSVEGYNKALENHPDFPSMGGKASASRVDENGDCIIAKNLNKRCWQCTETGHISTAGGLSNYQKARGIDTSKRVKIIPEKS